MKISKLILKNIKCFKEVEIPFESNNNIKNWSLFVGDNGQGKTTILRSLAIGLCEKEGASALLAELHGGFLRDGENEGSIEVSLGDKNGKTHTIKTEITSDGNNESIKQDSPERLTREDIFAVAYGSGRTIRGTESYEEYALVDSLYTLFNYEYGLQNVELGARRVQSEGKDESEWNKLKGILKEVLQLEDTTEIVLGKSGLYIKSNKWWERSFNSLSDGYQSLTSVILDFLSWKLLNSDEFDLNSISGIVIIDEIEQHLHPRWQRSIINSLSDKFPKIQFICSTHAPLCALGLADLETDSQLIKSSYVNGHSDIEIFDLKKYFKGYRADQILTSGIFGLSDTRNLRIEDLLNKYRKIYLKDESSRTEEEKKSLEEIKSTLGELPMWDHEEDRERIDQLVNLLKDLKSSALK